MTKALIKKRRTPVKNQTLEIATILIGLSSIILSIIVGVNQIEINSYNKNESESAKNLINYAIITDNSTQMRIIPYSSEFYNLRSFLYLPFDGNISKRLFDQPLGTINIADVKERLKYFVENSINLKNIEKNMAVFDGYPIVIENSYIYKGRVYHTQCLYYLLFTVNISNNGKKEDQSINIEIKNMLYNRSINSVKNIEVYLQNEEKKYKKFINNSHLSK